MPHRAHRQGIRMGWVTRMEWGIPADIRMAWDRAVTPAGTRRGLRAAG